MGLEKTGANVSGEAAKEERVERRKARREIISSSLKGGGEDKVIAMAWRDSKIIGNHSAIGEPRTSENA